MSDISEEHVSVSDFEQEGPVKDDMYLLEVTLRGHRALFEASVALGIELQE